MNVPYEGSPIAYDVTCRKNVMTPMRDGVRLAVDIYLPSLNGSPAEGRFPVIVERTPYDKAAAPAGHQRTVFREAGLCDGHPGRSRQVRVRGRVVRLRQGGAGRVRHGAVAWCAGVEQRQGRDDGRLVFGQ